MAGSPVTELIIPHPDAWRSGASRQLKRQRRLSEPRRSTRTIASCCCWAANKVPLYIGWRHPTRRNWTRCLGPKGGTFGCACHVDQMSVEFQWGTHNKICFSLHLHIKYTSVFSRRWALEKLGSTIRTALDWFLQACVYCRRSVNATFFQTSSSEAISKVRKFVRFWVSLSLSLSDVVLVTTSEFRIVCDQYTWMRIVASWKCMWIWKVQDMSARWLFVGKTSQRQMQVESAWCSLIYFCAFLLQSQASSVKDKKITLLSAPLLL